MSALQQSEGNYPYPCDNLVICKNRNFSTQTKFFCNYFI